MNSRKTQYVNDVREREPKFWSRHSRKVTPEDSGTSASYGEDHIAFGSNLPKRPAIPATLLCGDWQQSSFRGSGRAQCTPQRRPPLGRCSFGFGDTIVGVRDRRFWRRITHIDTVRARHAGTGCVWCPPTSQMPVQAARQPPQPGAGRTSTSSAPGHPDES
jgi:hypothetical protein